MADQYEISSDTKRQKADGTWEQKIKVCVKDGGAATADKTIWVTTHPWHKDGNNPKAKIGERRYDKLEFKVGEKCKELVFEFPKEPYQAYTDLYNTKNGNKFEDKITWNVNVFAAMPIPKDQTGRAALVAVLPIVYPFSLEQQELGAMQFRVKPFTVPPGWILDFVVPAVGELVTLQPPEKSIPLTIGFSNPAAVPEGYKQSFIVEVEPVFDDLTEEEIQLETAVHDIRIVKDTIPPAVVPQGPIIDRGAGTVTLAWTVTDAVSGVQTPHLRYSLDTGRTWKGWWPDLSVPVYDGDLLISGRFTAVVPYCGARDIRYELLASDEALNTGTTGVEILPL